MSLYKMLPAHCFESFPINWGYKDQIKVTNSRVCQPAQLQISESPNITILVQKQTIEKLGVLIFNWVSFAARYRLLDHNVGNRKTQHL